MSSDLYETLLPQRTRHFRATVLPDGRWLLYNQADNLAITLVAPAGILWELCDGQTPVAALIEQLQELYPEVPAAQVETETIRILQDFLEQGLVINDAEQPH